MTRKCAPPKTAAPSAPDSLVGRQAEEAESRLPPPAQDRRTTPLWRLAVQDTRTQKRLGRWPAPRGTAPRSAGEQEERDSNSKLMTMEQAPTALVARPKSGCPRPLYRGSRS